MLPKYFFTLYFSNATNYDLHLVLNALSEIKESNPELIRETNIVPLNTSKLRSLSINNLEFKGRQKY